MKTSAPTSARKATNVTLDAALLADAKSLHINVSQASEEGLARAIAAKRADIWMKDNRAALESSNSYVDRNGLPLARHRNF